MVRVSVKVRVTISVRVCVRVRVRVRIKGGLLPPTSPSIFTRRVRRIAIFSHCRP